MIVPVAVTKLQTIVRAPLTVLVMAAIVLVLLSGCYLWGRSRGAGSREAILREERERMARELHDVLAPGLTAVFMRADAALHEGDPEGARQTLRLVKRLARQTLLDTKRVLFELRPLALEDGLLPEALRRMLATMTEGLPVQGFLTIHGVPRVPRGVETARHLFHIAQEAVTNALRHSRARRIDLVIRFEPSAVVLLVRDDGGGSGAFARDEVPCASTGLRGMRERAEAIGAFLSVSHQPNGGVEVLVQVQG